MPTLDYSKWDHVRVFDSDEDGPIEHEDGDVSQQVAVAGQPLEQTAAVATDIGESSMQLSCSATISSTRARARHDNRYFSCVPSELLLNVEEDILHVYHPAKDNDYMGVVVGTLMHLYNDADKSHILVSAMLNHNKHVACKKEGTNADDLNALMARFGFRAIEQTMEKASNVINRSVVLKRCISRPFISLTQYQRSEYKRTCGVCEDDEYDCERMYFFIWLLQSEFASIMEAMAVKGEVGEGIKNIVQGSEGGVTVRAQAFLCSWLYFAGFIRGTTRLPVIIDIGRQCGSRRLNVALLKLHGALHAFAVNSEHMNCVSCETIYDSWFVDVHARPGPALPLYSGNLFLSVMDVSSGASSFAGCASFSDTTFEIVEYPHVVVIPFCPSSFGSFLQGGQKDKEEAARRELNRYTNHPGDNNIRVMVEILEQKSPHGLIILRNLAYSHPEELPMRISSAIIVLNNVDICLDLYPELQGEAAGDKDHKFDLPIRVFPLHFPPFLTDADRSFFENMEKCGRPFSSVEEAAQYYSEEFRKDDVRVCLGHFALDDITGIFQNECPIYDSAHVADAFDADSVEAALLKARELAKQALLLLHEKENEEIVLRRADEIKQEQDVIARRWDQPQIKSTGKKGSKRDRRKEQRAVEAAAVREKCSMRGRLVGVLRAQERKVAKHRHFTRAYNQLYQSGLMEKFSHEIAGSGGRHHTLHGPGMVSMKLLMSLPKDVNINHNKHLKRLT